MVGVKVNNDSNGCYCAVLFSFFFFAVDVDVDVDVFVLPSAFLVTAFFIYLFLFHHLSSHDEAEMISMYGQVVY